MKLSNPEHKHIFRVRSNRIRIEKEFRLITNYNLTSMASTLV
jgi:hypothetical protein